MYALMLTLSDLDGGLVPKSFGSDRSWVFWWRRGDVETVLKILKREICRSSLKHQWGFDYVGLAHKERHDTRNVLYTGVIEEGRVLLKRL
jgi:hypothetical protein